MFDSPQVHQGDEERTIEMTPLRIVMDIEVDHLLESVSTHEEYTRAFGKMEAVTCVGDVTDVGGLPKGTSGGKATVYVAGHLPDGRPVILETTLALLTTAVSALNARYGD